jgi:hypothetical protein
MLRQRNDDSPVPQIFSKKCLLTNFFKKSLIKNGGINFKRLIPKPYRRDQPAQRLVINRRNGCGATVAVRQVAGIVSHREREFDINY